MRNLNELNERMMELLKQQNKYAGLRFVSGEGNPGAEVMLIGEAPGAQEEAQGRPFVGKAGKNLDEFLRVAGLERSQLYVTNTVKFHPTRQSTAGNPVNRTPKREEIADFRPWLMEEILQVAPLVVVTLGNVPLQAVYGTENTVGELHGRWIPGDTYNLYPMYHPASLIYNPGLREVYREDILQLARLLKESRQP